MTDTVTQAGVSSDSVPGVGVPISTVSTAANIRWVAAIAAAGAIVMTIQVIVALTLPVPWIMPDELIYSELAKSLGSGSLPSIRGEESFSYGLLYPLVIAPAWTLFDDPARAYVAAKVVNSIVLSLTAIPVYFLARKYVNHVAALAVGTVSILVPSMLYTGALLTEVALYPTFALALLGIATALRRPTRRNQLLAMGGVALACMAKPLAFVLVPAYVFMIWSLAVVARTGDRRARIRAFATTFMVLVALGTVVIGSSTLSGNPDAILGAYGVVLGNIDVSGSVVWFMRHLAELDLYVAVVPFAATLALLTVVRSRRCDPVVTEFAALATWTVGGVLAAVAAYSSKPLAGAEGYLPSSARLHERNTFVVVPLLLLGLAIWLEKGRPSGRRATFVCTAIAVVLPTILPLSSLLGNANFQNLALIPWGGAGMTRLWPATFVPLAILAALVLLRTGPRSALACWMIVALSFSWTTLAAHASMSNASRDATGTGVGHDKRWIDHAVPRGSEVVALWVSKDAIRWGSQVIWMNEFFNRTVGDVVEIGTPMPYALPIRSASVDRGVVTDQSGTPLHARYVLVPCWVHVEGTLIAKDGNADASVIRTPTGQIKVLQSEPGPKTGASSTGGCP